MYLLNVPYLRTPATRRLVARQCYDSVNASGGATINKRVALEIGVVYRAARVEPRYYSVAVCILGGVADLDREDHLRRDVGF